MCFGSAPGQTPLSHDLITATFAGEDGFNNPGRPKQPSTEPSEKNRSKARLQRRLKCGDCDVLEQSTRDERRRRHFKAAPVKLFLARLTRPEASEAPAADPGAWPGWRRGPGGGLWSLGLFVLFCSEKRWPPLKAAAASEPAGASATSLEPLTGRTWTRLLAHVTTASCTGGCSL